MKKNNKIFKIPEIPAKIFEKLEKGEVIIFLGNGIARLGGVPSWKELALSYLEDWLESGDIDYDGYEKLKEKNPLELLTICSGHNSFRRENLKDKLRPKDEKKILEICAYLRDFKAGYVTTNYDDYIERAEYTDDKLEEEEKKLLRKLKMPVKEDLKLVKLSDNDNMDDPKNKIVYLHGKATCKENEKDCVNKIILTLKDYIDHYQDSQDNKYMGQGKKFLKLIFNKMILFIGLELQEFEIIQHILPPTSDVTHYLLLGVSEYEQCVLEEYIKYYKILNVEPIFFNKSEKGYHQLEDILKVWSKKIRNSRIKSYKDKIKSSKDFDNLKK
ncbi:MAG: SIR2 family protein [Endomicrobium sp.]|jgi:hypothetical protein|nr:SIR2 family protein [Endomicrobium sp.]